MLVPELAATPAEEPPRWDFASTRRWYAGLAAAAAALWFAAPLLVGPAAGRLPLIAIGMVLTAIWTAAAARHTVGSERVGWALLAVATRDRLHPLRRDGGRRCRPRSGSR